jgi:phosphatidylserine/phosphatidylglycerophosphate/cardiolipin synthase-like enzyme
MSLIASELHDEKSFYSAFLKDLECCQSEIIIESPYITASRMEVLHPVFEKLLENGIKIHIITRDPIEHEDEYMRNQSTNEILRCTELGMNIIMLNGFHHRKLAMIDRNILWEGSLNILSQTRSLEIMRRMENKELTEQMLRFLSISDYL